MSDRYVSRQFTERLAVMLSCVANQLADEIETYRTPHYGIERLRHDRAVALVREARALLAEYRAFIE